MKLHRPYFERENFNGLSDEQVRDAYTAGTEQVRMLLERGGYSPEFIGRLFRTPREKFIALERSEIEALPMEVSLDELASARCYGHDADELARYHAIDHEVKDLKLRRRGLHVSLPEGDTRSYAEVLKDPQYGPILQEREEVDAALNALDREKVKLSGVMSQFEKCKREERRNISLRKSGERLTDAHRVKLTRFAEVANLVARLGVDRAANFMPDEYEEMRTLAAELKAELPPAHFAYIVD